MKEKLEADSAHNRRSIVTLKVCYRNFVGIENLVELIEACGTNLIYSLLKRVDEKFVTENRGNKTMLQHPIYSLPDRVNSCYGWNSVSGLDR